MEVKPKKINENNKKIPGLLPQAESNFQKHNKIFFMELFLRVTTSDFFYATLLIFVKQKCH